MDNFAGTTKCWGNYPYLGIAQDSTVGAGEWKRDGAVD